MISGVRKARLHLQMLTFGPAPTFEGVNVSEVNYSNVKMLDLAQVETRTGRKKSWIYAAQRDGRFPSAIRFSSRCTRWRSSDIDKWLQEQCEQAGAK